MTMEEELTNPHVQHNAEAIWREALQQTEFGDVSTIYCYAPMATSDHRNGRCADFMVTNTDRPMTDAQRHAMGSDIVAYFIRNAKRLHVQGIIFYGHVWGFPGTHDLMRGPKPWATYRGPSGSARVYTGSSNPHHDHVHVQVSGAAPTSWLRHNNPAAGGSSGTVPKEDNMPSAAEISDDVLTREIIPNGGDGDEVFLAGDANHRVSLVDAVLTLGKRSRSQQNAAVETQRQITDLDHKFDAILSRLDELLAAK